MWQIFLAFVLRAAIRILEKVLTERCGANPYAGDCRLHVWGWVPYKGAHTDSGHGTEEDVDSVYLPFFDLAETARRIYGLR